MCTICNGVGVSSTSNCDECAATGNIDDELCSTCFGLGKKVVKCTRCEGTGIFSKEKCKICEGKGFIEINKREICSTCEGTGIYSTNKCLTCEGTGRFKKFCWICKGKGSITYPIE